MGILFKDTMTGPYNKKSRRSLRRLSFFKILLVIHKATYIAWDLIFVFFSQHVLCQFKLSMSFYQQPLNVKTSFHILFDHTIHPILTYGSELWGPFSSQKLLSIKDSYFLNICDKLPQEKLRLRFC